MFEAPEWLIELWAIFKPVLISLGLALLTYIAVKIKSDAKLAKIKSDKQIAALTTIASNDTTPQISNILDKMDGLSLCVGLMADMLSVAFTNSALDPEIKNNILALTNKIKYGSETDYVKQLESEKAALEAQIKELSVKQTPVIEETVNLAENTTSIRR